MKKISILALASALMLMLSACPIINKALPEIPVEFEIEASVVAGAPVSLDATPATKAGLIYTDSFSGSIDLKLSDLTDNSAILNAMTLVKEAIVSNPHLSLNPVNFSVANVKITAVVTGTSFSKQITIDHYKPGDQIPPAGWIDFFGAVYLQLINGKTVKVSITGETNANKTFSLTKIKFICKNNVKFQL